MDVEESMDRLSEAMEQLCVPMRSVRDSLVPLPEVLARFGAWAWVGRNEDKPHRCPFCHRISDRAREPALGPRTVLRCPDCRVRWRHGSRAKRGSWSIPSRGLRQRPWYGW